MKRLFLITVVFHFLLTTNFAHATSYNFSVSYDGSSEQVTSLDDPIATFIEVGDDFTYEYSGSGNGYWELATGRDLGFCSFLVVESANRYGNWSVDIEMDGTSVFFDSGINDFIGGGGLGTLSTSFFSAGFKFDKITFAYKLTDATPNKTTRIIDLDPLYWRGQLNTIPFISGVQAVPEPTTMLLFGTGIAGLATLGRRRK